MKEVYEARSAYTETSASVKSRLSAMEKIWVKRYRMCRFLRYGKVEEAEEAEEGACASGMKNIRLLLLSISFGLLTWQWDRVIPRCVEVNNQTYSTVYIVQYCRPFALPRTLLHFHAILG